MQVGASAGAPAALGRGLDLPPALHGAGERCGQGLSILHRSLSGGYDAALPAASCGCGADEERPQQAFLHHS